MLTIVFDLLWNINVIVILPIKSTIAHNLGIKNNHYLVYIFLRYFIAPQCSQYKYKKICRAFCNNTFVAIWP